jgi:hypothetical protein
MVEFRYRGRQISQEDILYIRALVEHHPHESRRTLSTKLCEAWQWRQANGALRDMVCRGMLLMLERAGQITLPPVSYVRHNPLAKRIRPEPAQIDATPIEDRLRNLQPLEFEQVRRTGKEPLFNSLVEEHHYLGYEQPVGEHMKYLVSAQGRPVACLAWSSAPRHLGSRDRYMGWSAEAATDRRSGCYVDPSCRHPKPQAGFLELPPCPPASRRRPTSEASGVPRFQCCRICGSVRGEKASRSPCSGRIVSHGQYTTVAVKRNTVKAG